MWGKIRLNLKISFTLFCECGGTIGGVRPDSGSLRECVNCHASRNTEISGPETLRPNQRSDIRAYPGTSRSAELEIHASLHPSTIYIIVRTPMFRHVDVAIIIFDSSG